MGVSIFLWMLSITINTTLEEILECNVSKINIFTKTQEFIKISIFDINIYYIIIYNIFGAHDTPLM